MVIIKNLFFGVAIFILTLFVGIYGISTLYEKSPDYNDYCPSNLYTIDGCLEEGGVWVNTTDTQIIGQRDGITKPVPVEGGYCQYDYIQCQEEFDNAQEKYHRKVFFIAVP